MSDKKYKNGEFQDNGLMYDDAWDINHDGKVDWIEDMERRKDIERSQQHYEEWEKNRHTSQIPDEPKFITTVFSDESKKDYSNPPSSGATIIACIIVCILCFGAIIFCVNADIGALGIMLMLGIAVGLSIAVLKGFGVMR
ncbi:MAG: hypothetical protein IJI67_03570 [Clostridia bacterium]|nr:hypothetical protein [Clostridia bacterium]